MISARGPDSASAERARHRCQGTPASRRSPDSRTAPPHAGQVRGRRATALLAPASNPFAFHIKRLHGSDPLHAMACKDLFTRRTQPCAVLLQALLNGCIITQLFSAKAGSIARTSLLLLCCSGM